jgi:hypothetical protein
MPSQIRCKAIQFTARAFGVVPVQDDAALLSIPFYPWNEVQMKMENILLPDRAVGLHHIESFAPRNRTNEARDANGRLEDVSRLLVGEIIEGRHVFTRDDQYFIGVWPTSCATRS